MRENFDECLSRLAVHEGGYVNDPKDPGGPTNRGVTQRVYDGYRKARKLRTRSVKDLTDAEHRDIYFEQYWLPAGCEVLPGGLDYVQFDGAVNSGPKQAVKWLQRALNRTGAGLKIDGVWGNATAGAVARTNDVDGLIDRVCDQRLAFMKALKTWSRFGRGWSRRVSDVRKVGKAWTDESIPMADVPFPDFQVGAEVRAVVEDAVKRPTKAAADAITGAGIGTATIAQTIQGAIDQLNPLAGASAAIGHVVLGLTILGVVATVGGLAYRVYQKRRETERADALNIVAE